jgi:hypothetical protein
MNERITEAFFETNNATHIQQFALALVDAGFDVETVWQDDGVSLTIYPPGDGAGAQNPRIIEP